MENQWDLQILAQRTREILVPSADPENSREEQHNRKLGQNVMPRYICGPFGTPAGVHWASAAHRRDLCCR